MTDEIIRTDEKTMYFTDDKRHRAGGLPAIECANGSKWYYENDNLHRAGGLPAVERSDGDKEYYENGVQLFPETKA